MAQRGLRTLKCIRCDVEYRGRKGQRYCSRRCSAFCRAGDGTLSRTTTSFAAGNAPWNKGLPNWRPDYRHSPETIEAIRLGNSGERANNWKGGLTEINYRIRRSKRYAHWRTAVFERDGYTCQACRAKSVVGKRIRLEADHLKPFAQYPELRFEVTNGLTLCAACHRKTSTWGVGGHRKAFTGQTATRPDGTPF